MAPSFFRWPSRIIGTDYRYLQILTMSNDEEVAFAAIAAVAQAKMGQYDPVSKAGGGGGGGKGSKETGESVGADAKTLAEMLVREEKKVLGDLRVQLLSEVRAS